MTLWRIRNRKEQIQERTWCVAPVLLSTNEDAVESLLNSTGADAGLALWAEGNHEC